MIDLRQELSQLEQRSADLFKADGAEAEYLVARLREELSTSIEELHAADDMLRSQRQLARDALNEGVSVPGVPVLLDFAGLAFLETNHNGVIVRTNEEVARRLGRQARFLVGKPLAVLIHNDDRPNLRSTLTHALIEPSVSATLRFKRQDKSEWTAEATVVQVADGEEHTVQWLLLDQAEQAGAARSVSTAFHVELDALASIATVSPEGEEPSMQRLLDHVAGVAHLVIDADWTTVQVGIPRRLDLESSAGDGPAADAFSRMQWQDHVGPIADAFDRENTVSTHDVVNDPRWESIQDASIASGVHAVIAIPIVKDGKTLGVLTAYRGTRQAFSEAEVAALEATMEQIVPVILNRRAFDLLRRETENLTIAMATRAVIEQAKGMVMCVDKCSEDEAFTKLRELSQRSNVKLRALAVDLVEKMSAPRP